LQKWDATTMRMSNSSVAIAVFFGCALVAGPSAAAETLRVGGTGSAIGMLQQVGAEFTAATGIKVEVVTSLGSNGAIRALADSMLDIAVPARPLKTDEPPPACAKSRCYERLM
jgi:phosphate transport system substrate-binding protein